MVPGRWNSPDGSPDSTKKPRSGWPHRLLLAFLCSALLSVFSPFPALSQAVRGRVIDDRSNDGIEGVAITLFRYGRKGRTVSSDRTGEFFLPLPGGGLFSLEAGRIGYATSRSRQFIAELTDTITVEFRLDVEAILLDPLVVTAVDGRGESRFKRHREEWGRGVFLSPAVVDSIQPKHPADIFRGQEKTRFIWDGLRTQRLDRPYIRKNGKLTAATWAEAFAAIAEKVAAASADKVGAIAGDLSSGYAG